MSNLYFDPDSIYLSDNNDEKIIGGVEHLKLTKISKDIDRKLITSQKIGDFKNISSTKNSALDELMEVINTSMVSSKSPKNSKNSSKKGGRDYGITVECKDSLTSNSDGDSEYTICCTSTNPKVLDPDANYIKRIGIDTIDDDSSSIDNSDSDDSDTDDKDTNAVNDAIDIFKLEIKPRDNKIELVRR